jgi:transposase
MILLASATGMSAPEIARLVRTDEPHVRKVIHAFNAEGFSSLDPDYRGGRPNRRRPSSATRERLRPWQRRATGGLIDERLGLLINEAPATTSPGRRCP